MTTDARSVAVAGIFVATVALCLLSDIITVALSPTVEMSIERFTDTVAEGFGVAIGAILFGLLSGRFFTAGWSSSVNQDHRNALYVTHIGAWSAFGVVGHVVRVVFLGWF